ncbi:hypothetical protein EII12_03060 [Buchananella hordeovulneris]|uniref:hypothetical protein n=1 Tax=Buchananella hordeovulneris TaxID=52770 RepID=UPI000F5FA3F1|nr:hypothetical protein [Buchananella hordeovulneris]RRD53086.1 hypothetical protein EII12_03060 [Buchananella hordeovulneris]
MLSPRLSLTALAAATALGTAVLYSSAIAAEETPDPSRTTHTAQAVEAADLPIWVLLDTTGELTPTAPARFFDESRSFDMSKEPTAELVDLYGQLQDFALSHEDIYADVNFSPDYAGIELTVKEGTDGENHPELRELIDSSALAEHVHVTLAPFSRAELAQANAEIEQLLRDFPGFGWSVPLLDDGALVVTIFAPEGTGASFAELQRQLATRADSPTVSVPILVEFSASLDSLFEFAKQRSGE